VRVSIIGLRQQAWRAEKLYTDFLQYARSIGCRVTHDEVESDDEQARKLANWWTENVS
jgi:hypothetical protein